MARISENGRYSDKWCHGPDYTTESGASMLKHRLETYWAKRSMGVDVRLTRDGSGGWSVRSDMKNGWPVAEELRI
jgi:hypothetical protein